MKTLLTNLVVESLAELLRLDTLLDLAGAVGLAAAVLSAGALLSHWGGLP